jgi:AMP phosphorylase
LEFQTRVLDIEAGGKYVVVMGAGDAKQMGVMSNDRVKLRSAGSEVVAILNIAEEYPEGILGVFEEPKSKLDLSEGDSIEVQAAERPESLSFIKGKIMGKKLTPMQIEMIIKDVVERHLSDIELASFVTSLQIHGTGMEEIEALSRAMIKIGKSISFNKPYVLDKHSIGGVPGDKTTLLVVPIIAAAGYTIPKSSSRAITSPAGTADRMEALCPVDLRIGEIIDVVEKIDACIVWGGSLDLAPADDLFIQIEYPLSIDPLLLPSILSKKKAMGSTNVVIDIPTGRGAKVITIGQAQQLAFDFIELGSRLGMKIGCAVTEGGQPIGHAIGPTLEAKEALETLMGKGPPDLIDKATNLAGILLNTVGEDNGAMKAMMVLASGKAEKKMRQIIEAQGGDPEVQPDDLTIGDKRVDIKADRDGRVLWINNRSIAQIARAAGTPNDKGAGLFLRVKLGDKIAEGETLFSVFAENGRKLNKAEALAGALAPIGVGKRIGEKMLVMEILESVAPGTERYILDR